MKLEKASLFIEASFPRFFLAKSTVKEVFSAVELFYVHA